MKKSLVIIGISVLATSLVLVGLTAWAFAQGNNIINACVAKDGSVRIVALEGQCKNKETSLNWNIQGDPGPQGEQGPPGVLGFYTVTNVFDIPASSLGYGGTVRCDVGDAVTGGGHRYLDKGSGSEVGFGNNGSIANKPIEADTGVGEGWEVKVWNDSIFSVDLEVNAICADLTP